MKNNNATEVLMQEIDWLQSVIDQVIRSYLLQESQESHWLDIEFPNLENCNSPYAIKVRELKLSTFDRLGLALSLAPHLHPETLDVFFGKNQIYDRGFTEFGGVMDKEFSGFIPTGQTLCFLISSTHPELRREAMNVLSKEGILMKEQILKLGDTENHIPSLNGILSITDRWIQYFLTGESS